MEMQEYGGSLQSILGEEGLAEAGKWGKTRDLLREALVVEMHGEGYVREGMEEFCEVYLKDVEGVGKLESGKVVGHVIGCLDKAGRNRESKLEHLRTLIMKYKEQKQKKQTHEEKTKKSTQRIQKKKFYSFLLEWARVYIQTFINPSSTTTSFSPLQQQSRRDFLTQFYLKTLQLHKSYVTAHFPIFQQTEGVKSIHSPLLKYQFFKIVKDINPMTMQLDAKAKNAAWISVGKSDNGKTFNRLATAYYKETPIPVSTVKNMVSERKKDGNEGKTVWGKGKEDERSKFLMMMEDAKECTFKCKK